MPMMHIGVGYRADYARREVGMAPTRWRGTER